MSFANYLGYSDEAIGKKSKTHRVSLGAGRVGNRYKGGIISKIDARKGDAEITSK